MNDLYQVQCVFLFMYVNFVFIYRVDCYLNVSGNKNRYKEIKMLLDREKNLDGKRPLINLI